MISVSVPCCTACESNELYIHNVLPGAPVKREALHHFSLHRLSIRFQHRLQLHCLASTMPTSVHIHPTEDQWEACDMCNPLGLLAHVHGSGDASISRRLHRAVVLFPDSP